MTGLSNVHSDIIVEFFFLFLNCSLSPLVNYLRGAKFYIKLKKTLKVIGNYLFIFKKLHFKKLQN